MSTVNKPWEMGTKVPQSAIMNIPLLTTGEFVLVKIAPPKTTNSVRDGLVSTFLMTSYKDAAGNDIETILAKESAGGYDIDFPHGKRGLVATKYRGPKNFYKFKDSETGDFYEIPQEKFSVEAAIEYCENKFSEWNTMSESEQDSYIDEYLYDMFMFGLSQDLMLPIKGDEFMKPEIGLKTELYRVYTPPAGGQKYGNTIITKWHKGSPSLTGDYTFISPDLAEAMYNSYLEDDTKFVADPTDNFDEDDTDDEII